MIGLRNAQPWVIGTIPGTATGTIGAVFAGAGNSNVVTTVWNGLFYNNDDGSIHCLCNGGHTDYDGNEDYKLDVTQETCAWTLNMSPSTSGAITDAQN